ncbi:Methyltransferase domain-containing protein [Micromonospora pattaloongensis]|uniref:Methyltransferase domain-containing protein n=1 Tax=Micromonospora pattaloongensis TaxID=405436 RepID=A0A1H3Q4C8_9ACTN|nr:class I SAM-dependent methyltransferase [Micromonospora pattaloongensis]SDZ08227.1 Methyltransferase domain-containing protein [Micromonospora pattaloongensis]
MGASRWSELTGGNADAGARYASRFAALAASGADVHGEARFCADRAEPGARVLDAGCGTGRVAIRLAELGYRCVGVDLDESMLAEARRLAPELPWIRDDLAELDLPGHGIAEPFDLIVAAGNVIPLLTPRTEPAVLARLTAHLRPGGLLVAGFGLDPAHLPLNWAPVDLRRYDEWCAAAGLALHERYATWDGEEYAGGGYAVSVHRRS